MRHDEAMTDRNWPPQYNPDDPIWQTIMGLIEHLPESYPEPTWGHLTLRVNRKLFAVCQGGIDGEPYSVMFKPNPDELPHLKADPRFSKAPHFTKWLIYDLEDGWDQDELKELLTDSYLMVAPVRLARLVDQPRSIDGLAVGRKQNHRTEASR